MIVAIDPMEPRREQALSFGATEGLDPTAPGVSEDLKRVAALGGFDWAIVTTGQPEAIALGIESIRPGGTACIVGLALRVRPFPSTCWIS